MGLNIKRCLGKKNFFLVTLFGIIGWSTLSSCQKQTPAGSPEELVEPPLTAPKVNWKEQLLQMQGTSASAEQFVELKKLASSVVNGQLKEFLEMLESKNTGGIQIPPAFIEFIFFEWAQKDPQAALKRALGQSAPVTWLFAVKGGLTACALQVDENKQPNDILDEVMKEWTKRDAVAAMLWVMELPEGAWQTRAIGSIISNCATSDREKIKSIILQMTKTSVKNATLLVLFKSDMKGHPEDACKWAQENLRGEERTLELGALTRKWAQNDPAAALDWVMQTPLVGNRRSICSGTLRDLILLCAETNPRKAIEFAIRMPDEYHGQNVLEKVLHQVAQKDASAVEPLIQHTGLPDEQKEELRVKVRGATH